MLIIIIIYKTIAMYAFFLTVTNPLSTSEVLWQENEKRWRIILRHGPLFHLILLISISKVKPEVHPMPGEKVAYGIGP